MTDPRNGHGADSSVFRLGATLLRRRWTVARYALACATLAGAFAFTRPPLYTAFASFVPQSTDAARSGLASLAGQFGVQLPAGSQQFGPDFYTRLLKSRVILKGIVRDTFVVSELGGRKMSFAELFDVKPAHDRDMEEEGVRALGMLVQAPMSKPTGVVDVSVATRWPSVSLAIIDTLIKRVNEFNLNTRQGQAASERRFVEARLGVADSALRSSEDRLQSFLTRNRQFGNAPELTFERERLQRDLSLKQQTFTTLTQSLEEVRIREVRDTPVITMVEQPTVDFVPQPRGRASTVLLGLIVGIMLGIGHALIAEVIERGRQVGDPSVTEFLQRLSESRSEVASRLGRLRRSP